MSAGSQSFPESIDDVLSAVQETVRGRWFLQAYAERLQKSETATILASIAKLEASLNDMKATGGQARLIETTKAAIAAARKEIQQLNPEAASMSREGQLFAKLAEQSRQAFGNGTAAPGVGKSVERALRLVAELEQDFIGSEPETAIAAAPSNPAQYFKQDEAIFEPAPVKPALVVAEAKPAADPASRGARLVIERVGETTGHSATLEASRVDLQDSDRRDLHPQAEAEERPRITIIRRNIEDLPEVPLPENHPVQEAGTAA